jgi:hypothetical protein
MCAVVKVDFEDSEVRISIAWFMPASSSVRRRDRSAHSFAFDLQASVVVDVYGE